MEPDDNQQWDFQIPVLLSCLRNDIKEIVTKLELSDEDRQRLNKLIDQIRTEESKYEETVRAHFHKKMEKTTNELLLLKETCSQQQNEIEQLRSSSCDNQGRNGNGMLLGWSFSLESGIQSSQIASLQAIQGIREDLVNLSMELRLSVEMELSDMQGVIGQLTSTLQNLAERYRALNSAYIKECDYRRKVCSYFRFLRRSSTISKICVVQFVYFVVYVH